MNKYIDRLVIIIINSVYRVDYKLINKFNYKIEHKRLINRAISMFIRRLPKRP